MWHCCIPHPVLIKKNSCLYDNVMFRRSHLLYSNYSSAMRGSICRDMKCRRYRYAIVSAAQFSSDAPHQEYSFYQGFYSKKLKFLRRISLTSSVLSAVGLPIVIGLGIGGMSMAAKISIASTAAVASFGSTAILHAITHPYITDMKYVDADPVSDRFKVKATRLNLFGNPRTTEFYLDDMKEVKVTSHPYANFEVNGKYYYVRHESIENGLLRNKIESRCSNKNLQN